MNKTKPKILILSSVLFSILSCGGTTALTKRLNDQYTDIHVKNDCTCVSDEELANKGRYMPPLSLMLDQEKFNKAANWRLVNDYESIRFINMHSGFNMSLVSKNPFQLKHKNNAFTLNFTPCDPKNEFYIIPQFFIDLKKQDQRDLNEDFDYSAFAYFDYLISGINMREGIHPKAVLKGILEEHFFYIHDSDTSNEFKLFIREINIKYDINIKEYEVLYTEKGMNTVDEFIQELENTQIDISKFIVNEFVSTEKSAHRINQEEKRRLKDIFSIHEDLFFEKIDFKLKNQLYNGYIFSGNDDQNKVTVEINTAILRKWNATANQPELDADGNEVMADILMHTDGFKFSNYSKDEMEINDFCTSISEITGTGVLIEFDKAELVFPQKEITYNYHNLALNVKDYPLFRDHQNEEGSYQNITKIYDPELTNFSGLLISNSNIQMPIDGILLAVRGKNIILNNHFVSGILKMKKEVSIEKSDEFRLSTNKSPLKISKDELVQHFKNIGIGHVEIEIKEESILIYFKKELKQS